MRTVIIRFAFGYAGPEIERNLKEYSAEFEVRDVLGIEFSK